VGQGLGSRTAQHGPSDRVESSPLVGPKQLHALVRMNKPLTAAYCVCVCAVFVTQSPHRSPGRQCFMSAAVGASAARLGGRQRAAGGAEAGPAGVEQWLAGSSPAGE